MPATAATTAPEERVLRRLEVIPVIARLVVVALVEVLLVEKRLKEVEEAEMRPPVKLKSVEVALPTNE